MVKNRTSPKKPLIAAFVAACLDVGYSLGYRGKYNPSASPLSFEESAQDFVLVLSAAFIVFYLLRLLGVQMGPWGGKEEDTKPSEPTRQKGP